MKKCYKCQKYKSLEEFNLDRSRGDGHQSMCRKCSKIYKRKDYKNNKVAYMRRNGKAKINKTKFIRNLKETNPCKDCNRYFPYWVMQYDHLKDKSFSLCRANVTTYGKNKILDEIKKCELVCANCHYNRTYMRRPKAKFWGIRPKYALLWSLFDEVKSQTPCIDCNKCFPSWVMHYDHIREKKFEIGRALDRRSLDEIFQEIKNCELVCANCHMNRTYYRRVNKEIILLC